MQPACPGPYEIQEPERFFLPDFYNFSFNPEVPAAAQPLACRALFHTKRLLCTCVT